MSGVRAWDELRPPELDLIRDCVHCGFCLSSCPSYAVFHDEPDSPRGRIVLMGHGLEQNSELSPQLVTHIDRCLGCMACVTACPSGVQYDRLIERVRPQVERRAARSLSQRAWRKAIFALFTHPARLRALVPLLALQRVLALDRLLARAPQRHTRALARLAPAVPLRRTVARLPRSAAAHGDPRGTVALMQGCVQRVFFGDVNAATVRVLTAEGWEVQAPPAPRCCGALMLHGGAEQEGRSLAKDTIAAYESYSRVVVNVAGCGSAMKDYGHLLADDRQWAGRARDFSAKVLDIHELLAAHPARATRHPLRLRVAYHDACHLAHAQKVRREPRELLRAIPGLELIEPPEWELCCGSAGIYNLLQPDSASELGRRKAANLAGTGAQAIAAANPGCAMQIAGHLPRPPIPILHPITIIDHSLRGASI